MVYDVGTHSNMIFSANEISHKHLHILETT